MARTRSIATIYAELNYPSLRDYLTPFEAEIAERGYTSLLMNAHSDLRAERMLLQKADDLRVDGIVWYPVGYPKSFENAPKLHASVVIQGSSGGGYSSVRTDFDTAARLCAERLTALGHKRVAYLHNKVVVDHTDLHRLLPLHLNRLGAALDTKWSSPISGDLSEGLSQITELFSLPQHPTAIVTRPHLLQILYLALARRGLAVPDDMSVITVGDSDAVEFAIPPTDAVRWDAAERARLAVNLLVHAIEHPPQPSVEIAQQVHYEARHSTSRPRTAT